MPVAKINQSPTATKFTVIEVNDFVIQLDSMKKLIASTNKAVLTPALIAEFKEAISAFMLKFSTSSESQQKQLAPVKGRAEATNAKLVNLSGGNVLLFHKNETEPEPTRQTTRVVSFNKKQKFNLFSEQMAALHDKNNKKIFISENLEVVKLTNTLQNGLYTEIIVWLDNTYYRGYILSGALNIKDPDEKISDKNLLTAFLNDVEHTVFRVEHDIDKNKPNEDNFKDYPEVFKEQLNKYIKNLANVFFLLKKVKSNIILLKNKKIKFDNKISLKIQQQQERLLEVLKEQPGKAIENVTNLFFEHYPIESKDVNNETKRLKDVLVVIPLTRQWFLKQDKTIVNIFTTKLVPTGITWDGTSGEVLPSDVEDFFIFIEVIKFLKQNANLLDESSEKQWLIETSINQLERSKAIIILQDGGLSFDLSTIYAADVSVLQQFGNLKIIPLQTIITHELNMCDSSFCGPGNDTHLDRSKAAEIYTKIANDKKIDINEVQETIPKDIDFLYQSRCYLELININYIFDEIIALQ